LRIALASKLAAIEARFDGEIVVGSIGPSGLGSISLRDVSFRPSEVEGAPPWRIAEVRLAPDWSAIVRGEPGIRSIEVLDPTLRLDLSADGEQAAWLNRMAGHAPDAEVVANDSTGAMEPPSRLDLPHVTVIGGEITAVMEPGLPEPVGVRIERLDLVPGDDGLAGVIVDGRVEIDGFGRALLRGELGRGHSSVELRTLEDNDLLQVLPGTWVHNEDATLSLGSMSFEWPPAVTLHPVSLRDAGLRVAGVDGVFVDNVRAERVRIELLDTQARAVAEGVRVDLASYLATASVTLPTTSYAREFGSIARSIEAIVDDGTGGVLPLRAEVRPDGSRLVRAQSDGFDISALARLLPADAPIRVVSGRLRGRAEALRYGRDGAWTFSGAFFVDALRVFAPLLFGDTVRELSVGADGSWVVDPNARLVRLQAGTVRVGEATVELNADAVRSAAGVQRAEANVRVPRQPAMALLAAVPEESLSALGGLRLAGQAAAAALLRADRANPTGARVRVAGWSDGVVVDAWPTAIPESMLRGDTMPVRDRDGEVIATIGPLLPGWTPLTSISPQLVRAVLASEDDGFYRHPGIDWRGIERALFRNLEAGRLVQGGSTISQQVVKMLFLSRERTLARKAEEAVLTWLAERTMGKTRILEAYFNLAEWGPGIRGIGQAATAYFARTPATLTLRESVFLASILPNPAVFGQQYADGEIVESRRVKMRNILTNMQRSGVISLAEFDAAVGLTDRGEVSAQRRPEFDAPE
jgi:hypothetical protein